MKPVAQGCWSKARGTILVILLITSADSFSSEVSSMFRRTTSTSASSPSNLSRSAAGGALFAERTSKGSHRQGFSEHSHAFRSKSASSDQSSHQSSPPSPSRQQTSSSSSSTELHGASLTADSLSEPIGYKIFCDLDGVLVDFELGIQKLMNCPSSQAVKGTMWKKVARAHAFYEHLNWMPDGKRLWNAIRPLKPDILTGVPYPKKSRVEKYNWCLRELGLDNLNHVDMASGYKDHSVVNENYPRDDATNIITCWSNNKPYESSYRT